MDWTEISVFNMLCNMHIWSFGSYGAMPDQKTMQMRCAGGFLTCGYQIFCSLPKKLGCLAQKRPYLPQNMHSSSHIGLTGSFGALLVGGCGARAALSIERRPTLYFILYCFQHVESLGGEVQK